MMWILLGYYLAMMTGDVHSPYQRPAVIQDIRVGFSETVSDSKRKTEILQAMDGIEKAIIEDNKRLLRPLKHADKLIAKGELERDVLESFYMDFSESHIQSIRKNTTAMLELKKRVSQEEWEKVFQQVLPKWGS